MTRFLLLAICLVASSVASAQSAAEAEAKSRKNALSKGALASPFESNYDVHHVKIDLAMTNLSTTISGNAITHASVTNPLALGKYVFELDTVLIIDSIKLNGALVTATDSAGFIRTVALSSPLAYGTNFTAQVWYHGTPPSINGFFTRGLHHATTSSGTQITFTFSSAWLAKDWWPCKQDIQDKIDSADIWITVPAGLKAGCNGLLQNVTPVGSSNRYEWKTKYPIDYYLLSASVAPYVDFSNYMHFTNGTPDSMLLQHYVYDPALNNAYQNAVDSTGILINYFSGLFGRYPFYKEKYGHCLVPLFGGMEHQTMTTIGFFGMEVMAHELAHQWWGDAVTYSSWKDIWLSEGWASYAEQLFTERFRNNAATVDYRVSVFSNVMSKPGGTLIVDDTTNVNRIFDSRLTYHKGAAVAHMLRRIAPSDAVFFNGLQQFQAQYRYKSASTGDFKTVMENAYGRSLDTFFNQWVYGEGYPTFHVYWNVVGNTCFVKLTQTASKPTVTPLFCTPLQLQFRSFSGDSTVTVYSNAPVQYFTFTSVRPDIFYIYVDPEWNVLQRYANSTQDTSLTVNEVNAAAIHVYPNPAKDVWTATNVPQGALLSLTDISGRLIWNTVADRETILIPAKNFPPGTYQLVIRSGNKEIVHSSLQHL